MKERLFKFKQFSISHARSAMKVGVDGVLIGAWTTCQGERILDVGTGCGLIALMLAQRNRNGKIDAIDIDPESIDEAKDNVLNSPWKERICVEQKSFKDLLDYGEGELYDLIVSNPPFYDSGIKYPMTPRERSRHQSELSPSILLSESGKILRPGGILSLIAPASEADQLLKTASENGFYISRICYVKDHCSSFVKRVMIEAVKYFDEKNKCFSTQALKEKTSYLVMFEESGLPTPEYRELCSPFYLKF